MISNLIIPHHLTKINMTVPFTKNIFPSKTKIMGTNYRSSRFYSYDNRPLKEIFKDRVYEQGLINFIEENNLRVPKQTEKEVQQNISLFYGGCCEMPDNAKNNMKYRLESIISDNTEATYLMGTIFNKYHFIRVDLILQRIDRHLVTYFVPLYEISNADPNTYICNYLENK